MTLCNTMKANINNIKVGTYPSIQALARAFNIEQQFSYPHFKNILSCLCDFTSVKEGNAERVEIIEIYNEPKSELLSYTRGDTSKLKYHPNHRKARCVYVIYSKENDLAYIGSTCSLINRFSYWKCVSKQGSKEAGAEVFRKHDSIMIPLFVAWNHCTLDQLRIIEKSMIQFSKVSKGEQCQNIEVLEVASQSFFDLGEFNWDVISLIGSAKRVVISSEEELKALCA